MGSAEQKLTPQEKLSIAFVMLKKRAPYFAQLRTRLVVKEDAATPTLSTSKNLVMRWNAACVAGLSLEETTGAIFHELLHVINRHFDRGDAVAKHFGLDAYNVNLALDRAINPTVVAAGFSLPQWVVWPRDIGMADGLTAEEYAEAAKKRGGGGGNNQGKGNIGAGGCGSCAAGHDKDDDDPIGRTPIEVDRTLRETAQAVSDFAAKHPGEVPAELQRWAAFALRPSSVPWQKKLAHACQRATAWATGQVDYRFDGIGRKQAALGYGIRKPIMPRLRAPVPKIAVAVDTSGSMGAPELAEALSETQAVLRAAKAKVTFIACDAKVHAIKEVRSIQEIPALLVGGGGTDMRPIFKTLEKRPSEQRPDVVIVATDGWIPDPGPSPKSMRVIWLIVGENKTFRAPWGDVITIPKEEKC